MMPNNLSDDERRFRLGFGVALIASAIVFYIFTVYNQLSFVTAGFGGLYLVFYLLKFSPFKMAVDKVKSMLN